MSYFSDLNIQIQEDIEAGLLTFSQIAEKYNITVCDVVTVFEEMSTFNQPDAEEF